MRESHTTHTISGSPDNKKHHFLNLQTIDWQK